MKFGFKISWLYQTYDPTKILKDKNEEDKLP